LNRKLSIDLKKSLGFRVFKTFVVVIVIVLSVHTSFSVFREFKKAKEHFISEGETLVGLLAYSSRLGVFAENRELLKNVAEGISNHKHVVMVSIYDADLKTLYEVSRISPERRFENYPASGDLDVRKNIAARLKTAESLEVIDTWNTFEFLKPVVMEIYPNIEERLYLKSKDMVKSTRIIGYVRIALDKHSFHEEILSIILSNAVIALIFILSTIIIIYFAIKRSTKPLERLTESVKRLGAGEKVEKIPVETDDEIGRLAATFNEMYDNLKKREEEKTVLEENLAQSRKMEAVGTLARGIAHDFNNILGTIIGSVYMLRKKLGRGNPLRSYTANIHNSIMKAKKLIEALLVFSRTQEIHSAPVDINTLIREMKPTVSSPADETVEYIETLSDEPLVVMADSLKMEQVMTNIISNALCAMPEGGRLSVKTEVVNIGADDAEKEPFKKAGRYALLLISDTGAGMSEVTKSKIFEPFFTTKEVGKGTGLGLSIVHGIIQEHKGYIDVDSQIGRGTTFRIYLPLVESNNHQVTEK